MHAGDATADAQAGVAHRSFIGHPTKRGVQALGQHQPHVEVVAAAERARPARAAGDTVASRISRAVVVELQSKLEPVALADLHHQVGSAAGGTRGDRRLRLDPRQVGKQQHGPFVLAAVQGLAGGEDCQRPGHPVLLHGRAVGHVNADVAQHALADGDLDPAVHHFLHRHEGLHHAESVPLVDLRHPRGQLLQIGKGHGGADLVGHRCL